MKEPWQWQEEDIQTLIHEQRTEDLSLEYKRCDALGNSEGKKAEITKDVSAMANSVGGVIIYGIDEQKQSKGPIQFDGGIDPNEFSIEWLEQAIDSGIHRRIDGIRFHRIHLSSTGRYVSVVSIPQSNRAPHMAADHRYHKRFGTTTAQMEEYEVRDVGRRAVSLDLCLDLTVRYAGPGIVRLQPRITNRSPDPVFYATIRAYAEGSLELQPNDNWSLLDDAELLWDNKKSIIFRAARSAWSVPERHPILEDEYYLLYHLDVKLGFDPARTPQVQRYSIGWELRAPKAAPKLFGLKLTVDSTTPRIEDYTYALAKT